MNQIRKEIYVTQKRLNVCIDVTYGSDLIPIVLKVVDYTIPSGAAATAYSIGKEDKLRKKICSISENEISFTPTKGFFDEGSNVMQVRVTHGSKDLISFEILVRCQKSIVKDDAEEVKNNPSLVEQLLSEIGVLSARLNEALSIPEGGTTADAALNDIKIGYDGTKYGSPGDAVREQVKQAMEYTDEVKTETDERITLLERYKATAIITSHEGETIVTTDSANLPPANITLYGKTTQETTEGNQLLPYPYADTTKTSNGITFTDNGDGSISIKGTSTDAAYFNLFSSNNPITLSADTYTVSSNLTNIRILTYKVDEKVYVSNTFTFTEDTKTTIWLEVVSGATVDATFYPMLNRGDTLKEWEPFTGGEASPNMNYPQELVHKGASGSIVNGILGKNLLKNTATTQTINGITFTVNEDKSVTCNGTATATAKLNVTSKFTLKAGERYLLSGCPSGGSVETYYLQTGFFSADTGSGGYGYAGTTITGVYVQILIKEGVTVSNLTFKPMIRYADIEDDTYVAPNDQPLTYQTPNGLPGIPVTDTSIATYIDENGQGWIADYVDFECGKYVQWVTALDADKFKGIRISIDSKWYDSDKSYSYEVYGISGYKLMNVDKIEGLSTHFTGYHFNSFYDNGIETGYMMDYAYLVVNISKSLGICTTIDEFKQWCIDNDVRFLKALAEPIETPLSEEELAQFNALCMNKGYNTIINDAGAYMKAELVADTQMHIKQNYISKDAFNNALGRISALEQNAVNS